MVSLLHHERASRYASLTMRFCSTFSNFSQQAKVIHLLLRLLARHVLDFRFGQHQA